MALDEIWLDKMQLIESNGTELRPLFPFLQPLGLLFGHAAGDNNLWISAQYCLKVYRLRERFQ